MESILGMPLTMKPSMSFEIQKVPSPSSLEVYQSSWMVLILSQSQIVVDLIPYRYPGMIH